MDQLDALRALVVTVDRGSLSAAARALGRSPASITRAVAAIEERIGAVLLQRTTRRLRLTDAGERYLPVARRVLSDLDEAEKNVGAATGEPHGILTVTAPLAFGALHVRPLVDAYLSAHPSARASLLLVDRLVNMVEEGIDVAIRIAHLADSALLAILVGSVRRVMVASPAYLARHGRPRVPRDLRDHRCIASTTITSGETWTFGSRRKGARAKQVRVSPVLEVNVPAAAIDAARSGVGITAAFSYQIAELVERGELVRLLAPFEPPSVPVHVVFPAANARTAKVRAFLEAATPKLRQALRRGDVDARRASGEKARR